MRRPFSGDYVLYRGREYRYGADAREPGHSVVLLWPSSEPSEFPDAIRFGRAYDDEFAVLPDRVLEALWGEFTCGQWREVEVGLGEVRGDAVSVTPVNGLPHDTAIGLGFVGNPHDGWYRLVPLAEVSQIRRFRQDRSAWLRGRAGPASDNAN